MSLSPQKHLKLQSSSNIEPANGLPTTESQTFALFSQVGHLSTLFFLHVIHFLISTFMCPIHSVILICTSIATFYQLISSHGSINVYQTKLTGSIFIYPIMSSLSTAFLSLFSGGDDLKTNYPAWFVSTSISTLIILVLTQFRSHSIFLASTSPNLQQERDEALQYAQEQEFIGSMLSHDSRNILHCLINSLNFLEIDLSAVNANIQKTKENLLGAKYCCETMLNYFNNYLENRKSAGNQQMTKSSLPEVVQRVQGIIKSAIEFNKLDAKITLEENTPKEIFFNESSLTQIMLNLIYNSIKFTEKGSINVSIGWKNLNTQTLDLSIGKSPASFSECFATGKLESFGCVSTRSTLCDLSRARSPLGARSRSRLNGGVSGLVVGTLIIKVSDTGCGMTKNEIDLLFQPFSQTHADPTKRRQGSGLGLWLTKTLVEKLDGQIRVESEVGEGSTFTVEIGCQAKIDRSESRLKKELTIESIRSTNSNTRFAGRSGLIFNQSPFENFLIKAYMKNFGIETFQEFESLDELWKSLEGRVDEEAMMIVGDKHIADLNGLYRWNKSLLNKKLVITLEDEGIDQVPCIVEGSQKLARPVKFQDFSHIIATAKKPVETLVQKKKGRFEMKLERIPSLEMVN